MKVFVLEIYDAYESSDVLGYDGLNVFLHGSQPEDPTNTALGNYKVRLNHFLRDVKK